MPEKKKSTQPTNSGIVTDKAGERFIPESQRADGSTRKAIKIRPGFRPTEDVELYRSRGTEVKNRPRGIPGAAEADPSPSAASNKNAKRREARKKAKAAGEEEEEDGEQGAEERAQVAEAPKDETEEAVDPEVEKAKKARALKKKLRQARELQNKKEGGESLLPEQIAKVIKINELVRELEALGFDADGEPKDKGTVGGEEGAETKG